jgi:hypothetical protein
VNRTADQMDALSEMVNIGMGQAAGILNDMVGSHVSLRAPVIDLLSPAALERKKSETQKAPALAGRVGAEKRERRRKPSFPRCGWGSRSRWQAVSGWFSRPRAPANSWRS